MKIKKMSLAVLVGVSIAIAPSFTAIAYNPFKKITPPPKMITPPPQAKHHANKGKNFNRNQPPMPKPPHFVWRPSDGASKYSLKGMFRKNGRLYYVVYDRMNKSYMLWKKGEKIDHCEVKNGRIVCYEKKMGF